MNQKLTLSVDDQVIARAKKYAESHQQSLSKIVENYLRLIVTETPHPGELGPLTRSLLGSVKVDGTIDYRDLRDQYLLDKYVSE